MSNKMPFYVYCVNLAIVCRSCRSQQVDVFPGTCCSNRDRTVWIPDNTRKKASCPGGCGHCQDGNPKGRGNDVSAVSKI